MHDDPRIADLRQWAAETGQPLPYSPQFIICVENLGHVVDLETGDITMWVNALPSSPPTTRGQGIVNGMGGAS